MFKISSYPSRAGMGSVLFAHYCSQKPWTQVELWRSCWEGRELEEKAWSLSREAWQPALPLERTDPVLCTHSQVSWHRRASDRAWNCLSSTSLGSKPRTKDCELSTDKNQVAAVGQASRELSPTALLFSQTCRSGCWGKKKRNKNQTTHRVISAVSLNLTLCKSTAQPWTCQTRIWVWCLSLASCAWLELWEPAGAQTKKHPLSQPF